MKLLRIKLDALEQEILTKALENIKNVWIVTLFKLINYEYRLRCYR